MGSRRKVRSGVQELSLDGNMRCVFYFFCLCPGNSVKKNRKSGGQEGEEEYCGITGRSGMGRRVNRRGEITASWENAQE